MPWVRRFWTSLENEFEPLLDVRVDAVPVQEALQAGDLAARLGVVGRQLGLDRWICERTGVTTSAITPATSASRAEEDHRDREPARDVPAAQDTRTAGLSSSARTTENRNTIRTCPIVCPMIQIATTRATTTRNMAQGGVGGRLVIASHGHRTPGVPWPTTAVPRRTG